jgi:hypothetical protein
MGATFMCLEEENDYNWHAHEDALDYTWVLVGVQNLMELKKYLISKLNFVKRVNARYVGSLLES